MPPKGTLVSEGHAPMGVMPPGTVVTSGFRLLCRTISGSVVLSQPRSVLMPMVPVPSLGRRVELALVV